MRRWVTRVLLVLGAGFVLTACHANGLVFVVTTTADTVDVNPGDGVCEDAGGSCSLRAAVMEANATAGTDHIVLTDGLTYTLTRAGAGEDAAQTGDLDLAESVVITGKAVIDADGIDRVIDVVAAAGLVELDGPDLTNGVAADGAAILVRGGASGAVLHSNIHDNTATSGSPVSATAGTLYLWSSTVHGNSGTYAGGVGGTAPGGLYLQNATISGNDGDVGAGGVRASGGAVIRYSTITDNDAIYVGGISAVGATIRGSIVAQQASGMDCDGGLVSEGYNVGGLAACGFTDPTDLPGADAELGPLADNGGAVLTQLPRATSPAIEHGQAAGCTAGMRDARDIARPSGAACDAGAVELELGADCSPLNLGRGAQLQNCDLTSVDTRFVDLTGADLTGAVVTGATIQDSFLDEIVAPGVDFSGAFLWGTTFDDADLRGAVFVDANLVVTQFPGADLTDADLTRSWLTGGDFYATILEETDFADTTLAVLRSDAFVGTPINVPAPWVARGGYFLGPAASLVGADLGGLDLSGLELAGANLAQADLSGADLSGTNLTDAFMWTVDLTGADATGARMSRVDVNRTIVEGTDFTDANLTGLSQFSGFLGEQPALIGTPAVLPHWWTLRNNVVWGPMTWPQHADQVGVDLPGADLSGIGLVDFDLTGADFAGADLRDSTVANTDLTDASFLGAQMTGTFFGSGITWSNTVCPDGTNTDTNGGTCDGHVVDEGHLIETDWFGPRQLAGFNVYRSQSPIVNPTLTHVHGDLIVEGTGVDWYIDDVLYRDDDLTSPWTLMSSDPGILLSSPFNGEAGGAANVFLLEPGPHQVRAEATLPGGAESFTATFIYFEDLP